jgi:hypothetical protein
MLTTDFDRHVRNRLRRDLTFREALLAEAAKCILEGDAGTGLRIIEKYFIPRRG